MRNADRMSDPQIRDVQITFDAADPAGQATFWAEVLGYRVQAPPPGFESWEQALNAFGVPPERHNDASAVVDPAGCRPRLFFQKVPEGKTVKNRVHLDVRAAPGLEGDARMAALEAECERLVALGTSRQRRSEPDPPMSGGFIVMQPPEGNDSRLDGPRGGGMGGSRSTPVTADSSNPSSPQA